MKRILFLFLTLCNYYLTAQKQLTNQQNKRLLLFGEQHRINESNEFFKSVVQDLSEQSKLNILVEFPVAMQPFIDDYMRTGDKGVFSSITNIFNCNDSCVHTNYHINKYVYFYELNKKLSVSKQINVYAVDADLSKNYILSLRSIKYLAKKHQLTALYNKLDNFINKKEQSNEQAYFFIKNLLEELDSKNKESVIRKEVQAIFNGIMFKKSVNRDSLMAQNINYLYKKYSNELFIGQFGNNHIKYIEDGKNMVTLLKNEKQYKTIGKEIVTWSYFYCHVNTKSNLKMARNFNKVLEKDLYSICDKMEEHLIVLNQKELKKRGIKEKRYDGIIFIKEANEIITCPSTLD